MRGRFHYRTALGRSLLLLLLLAAWEFVPRITALQRLPIFDPFFISSPTRVFRQVIELMSGAGETPVVWPFLAATLVSAVGGTVAGTFLGGALGLAFSNSVGLSDFLMPFVLALNAVPRIALIPIVLIIFGPSLVSSSVTAAMVVFFIVFFNAFTGGRSVAPHVLQNASVLGASRMTVMRYVRFPLSFAWTVAALPNAVSFGLQATVTAEILTGTSGMGRLMVVAVTSASSTLTFAVVVFLATVGWLMVSSTSLFTARWLHWWEGGLPT